MNSSFKTLLATGLLLAVTSQAHAQLSQGHLMLGGQFGFSSAKLPDQNSGVKTTTTSGNFAPRVGYFLANNLAVGLEIQYSGNKEVRNVNNQLGTFERTNTSTSLMVGPFARYYQPLGEKAAFFGHLSLGFGSEKQTVEYSGSGAPANPDGVKYASLGASLRPGFTYFPTKRLGLEIMTDAIQLGFYSRKQKDLPSGLKEEDYKTSSFTAKADLASLLTLGSVQIGAIFYFGGGE